jgi:hypothetical protein
MFPDKSKLTKDQRQDGLLIAFLLSMALGIGLSMGTHKLATNETVKTSGLIVGVFLLPVGAIHLYANKYL